MSTCRTADCIHDPFVEITSPGRADGGEPARAQRRARLPAFLGLEPSALARLDALRVMVIGSGSVGGNIVLHLARLQINQLWLVDPGRLKAESLLTHPIDPAAVGEPKVSHFGRLAKAVSPTTGVYAFRGRVQALPLAALAGVDLVVMATDNLAAEVEAGQRAIQLCKPLVQASVHGDTLVAQVRVWLNRDASGPCPACDFGAAEWDHVNRGSRFSCPGEGQQAAEQQTVAPTMSVSFLCSLAADMAVMQILRHVLRLGVPPDDSVVEYCGFTHETNVSKLKRNRACPCEHIAWDRVAVARPLGECSLRDLATAAGFDGAQPPADLSFLVDELTFADQALCCGSPQPIRRFCRPGDQLDRCSRCGSPLACQPFFSHRPVPAAVLSTLVAEPLQRLGAGRAKSVVVRSGGRSVLCLEEA